MDCIFCKIVKGEVPSKKVYEDDTVLAFKDINPSAPIHIIVIPKEHIACAHDINEENVNHIRDIFVAIPKIANSLGIDQYRIINNCGAMAKQTVFHIHFHIISGKQLP